MLLEDDFVFQVIFICVCEVVGICVEVIDLQQVCIIEFFVNFVFIGVVKVLDGIVDFFCFIVVNMLDVREYGVIVLMVYEVIGFICEGVMVCGVYVCNYFIGEIQMFYVLVVVNVVGIWG